MNHKNHFIPIISIDAIMVVTSGMIDDVVVDDVINVVVDDVINVVVVDTVDIGHFTAPLLVTITIFDKLSILFKKNKCLNK
jgi:hypothetical protein